MGAAWLADRGIGFVTQIPLLLLMMKIPAILVGIVMARGFISDLHLRLTGAQIGGLRRYGDFLGLFGIGMPCYQRSMAFSVGVWLSFSDSGITLPTILSASASSIALPAAMRVCAPEATPALSLAASLAAIFPFNVLAGERPSPQAGDHHHRGCHRKAADDRPGETRRARIYDYRCEG